MNANLIQIIETSSFNPSSPDPAGITYTGSNRLLIADSEVNEIPSLFTGDNLFEIDLSGNVLNTEGTNSFDDEIDEPTGLSYNPANGNLFIADDEEDLISVVDAQFQLINQFDTTTFGSYDPEGIAFAEGLGTLFIADGLNSEIYQVTTSGVLLDSFDTASLGVSDPEGIVYNPDSGNLFVIGDPSNTLFEITTTGNLLQTYDLSDANLVNPSGLALAPSSENPNETNIYIVDRGIDNDQDPNENDGKLYEFSLSDNDEPTVDAGEDQTITVLNVSLDGNISDNGLPIGGGVTSTWRLISGPGTVTFGDASAEDTTATFSEFGTYVLELEANDGELTGSDRVEISVRDPQPFDEIYVTTQTNGSVNGISFADEDILRFDVNTGSWSEFFDGSDVGLDASGIDVTAFHLNSDGSILLSLNRDTTVPTVGLVDDSDILRFVPTSTGSNTAGTFELFFDGSDVGLTTSGEDIDAIGFAPDGRLLLSTKASFAVPGASGGDEDLFAFTPTSLNSTSGTFELYFDGSDVGLGDTGSEDVTGISIDDDNGDIFLSTQGSFSVDGLSGDGDDIFAFNPSSTGGDTSGSFRSFFDGSTNGLGQVVDGFALI